VPVAVGVGGADGETVGDAVEVRVGETDGVVLAVIAGV